MGLLRVIRRSLLALSLVVLLTVTTACGGAAVSDRPSLPSVGNTPTSQVQRGDSAASQQFGDWVVQNARGLVQDAYVRDANKLGVVISPQVRPNDVRPLANSLVQGFRQNFPNRDLTVLMYAPDKQLILTARYDDQSKQVQYQ